MRLKKKVMLLSNLFIKKINNFIDSFDKKYVLPYHLTKNTISFQLLNIKKNSILFI